MIAGLALFSRALSWLLKTWYQETLSTIIGLLDCILVGDMAISGTYL